MPPPHRDRWILLIGITKAIKSASLVVLAALVLVLSHGDQAAGLRRWAFKLGINPGSHWLQVASERLDLLGHGKLELIAGGMALYAVLFAIEGAGLLLGKRWGEYVTIVISGSFIPIEVYETLRHPHVPRAVTIVLNVAAVAYLVHRVRRRAAPRAGAEGGMTSPGGEAACAPTPSRRY
jgi:uncharacterized membrane protein (DUF2068 family)